jgi:hypothetical protein
MPVPEGYFEIRVRSSKGFKRFFRHTLSSSKGIKAFMGVRGGKGLGPSGGRSVVIAYFFSKKKWTRERARKWVTEKTKKKKIEESAPAERVIKDNEKEEFMSEKEDFINLSGDDKEEPIELSELAHKKEVDELRQMVYSLSAQVNQAVERLSNVVHEELERTENARIKKELEEAQAKLADLTASLKG